MNRTRSGTSRKASEHDLQSARCDMLSAVAAERLHNRELGLPMPEWPSDASDREKVDALRAAGFVVGGERERPLPEPINVPGFSLSELIVQMRDE
jgi:hypothetical protein